MTRFTRLVATFAALVILSLPGFAPGADEGISRFAQQGEAKVHYRDFGSGERAVVLIHGWSCDSMFWKEQFPALAPRGRVIAVDLPGHGQSDAPDVEYTQEYLVRGVEAVLRHAGVRRAVFVGHSMGLAIARELARTQPKRAAGVAIIDGAYVPNEQADPETYQTISDWTESFVTKLKGPKREGAIDDFLNTLHDKSTPTALRKWVAQRMKATAPKVAASAMEHFIDPEVWRDGTFEGPSLAVYAVKPDLAPDNAEILRSWFDDLRYVEWTGAGHFLMLERPALVNGLLTSFLDDVKW